MADQTIAIEMKATTAAAVAEVGKLNAEIREATTAATVAGSAQQQLGKDVALTSAKVRESKEAVAGAKQALETHNATVTAFGASSTQAAQSAAKLATAEREAAKAYMAYRDAHAERRRLAIVTPELRAAYEAGAAAMGNDPLRTFQFFDKYSRWNGERRETWPECVDRAVEHLRWLVIRECGADRFTEGEWLEIRDAIRACDALPSMRLLSQAGAAARRDDVSIFNCSFQVIDSLECFRESLLISMAGAGDAYSVESQFIRELPLVRHQRGLRADTHVVEDTSEGWADALMVGLTRWFDGADVVFDYSALRPAGAILRTKGGRASGPAPLRTVLRLARSLVLSRQGSQLRQIGQGCIEVGDIGLMVTAVMDLHGQRIDVGFQRVIGIGKGWQGMAHGHLCLL